MLRLACVALAATHGATIAAPAASALQAAEIPPPPATLSPPPPPPIPRDCNETFLAGADPPHPACSVPPAAGSPRFALVLHGSVSTNDHASTVLEVDKDYPSDLFVNVDTIARYFSKHLMEPSGGAASFDVFIHSNVPSTAVRDQLLKLFEPVGVTFLGHYASVWGVGHNRSSVETYADDVSTRAISRWNSAKAALQLVADAEAARGAPYDKVYLTRPDVLLWTDVDLRRYCDDGVYQPSCYPPFFPARADGGCPADTHFVMTSKMATAFATLADVLPAYENTTVEMSNPAIERFVTEVVGVPLITDHVVIARHEELLRKTPHGELEKAYLECVSEVQDAGVQASRLKGRRSKSQAFSLM